MTTRRLWQWIILSVLAAGGLVILGIIGLVVWQHKDSRKFLDQTTTHDLRVRVEKMAATQ